MRWCGHVLFFVVMKDDHCRCRDFVGRRCAEVGLNVEVALEFRRCFCPRKLVRKKRGNKDSNGPVRKLARSSSAAFTSPAKVYISRNVVRLSEESGRFDF